MYLLNRDMDGNCFIHMFVLEIIKQHTCMLLRFALVSMSLLELVVLVVGLVIAVVLRSGNVNVKYTCYTCV